MTLPPIECLRLDRSRFFWPVLWGEEPVCGDDPCDELDIRMISYLMGVVREEANRKRIRDTNGFTPIKWTFR